MWGMYRNIDALGLAGSVGAGLAWATYTPDNASFVLSDHPPGAVFERSAERLRWKFPLGDPASQANAYEWSGRGARTSWRTDDTRVRLRVNWNGLVAREDTVLTTATLLVNGVYHGHFSNPYGASQDGGGESAHLFDDLPAGPKDLSLVQPIAAGMDTIEVSHDPEASFEPPSVDRRLLDALLVDGDSIALGVGGSIERIDHTWAYLLAEALGLQLINTADGSGRVDDMHASALSGVTNPALIVVPYGFNSFANGVIVDTYRMEYEGYLHMLAIEYPGIPIVSYGPRYTSKTQASFGTAIAEPAAYRTAAATASSNVGSVNVHGLDPLQVYTLGDAGLSGDPHQTIAGAANEAANLQTLVTPFLPGV